MLYSSKIRVSELKFLDQINRSTDVFTNTTKSGAANNKTTLILFANSEIITKNH